MSIFGRRVTSFKPPARLRQKEDDYVAEMMTAKKAKDNPQKLMYVFVLNFNFMPTWLTS